MGLPAKGIAVEQAVCSTIRRGGRRWAASGWLQPGALLATAAIYAQDAPRLLTVSGARGALAEATWTSLHLLGYPMGMLREQVRDPEPLNPHLLPPVPRGQLLHDVEASGTPIILVHGLVDNRAIFGLLQRRLRRRGFTRVFSVNYAPTTNDVRAAARALATQIEGVVNATGYERVHVVAHSLGGLIARYYVQRLGGDARVHTLVTLGSPHGGSLHAHLLPVRLVRQLRPGSDVISELQTPAPGCRTRFVAYWSDFDHVIVPHENAILDHPDLMVRNIRVPNVGHLSIPRTRSVAREISSLFSRLDSEGRTLHQGVTPLRGQGVRDAAT